jgi:hypothetical protein
MAVEPPSEASTPTKKKIKKFWVKKCALLTCDKSANSRADTPVLLRFY